jgi:hypothetical protein
VCCCKSLAFVLFRFCDVGLFVDEELIPPSKFLSKYDVNH